ncbi:hypothetical protein AVEN_249106-1 [Araneus ventricosus]|uniref:Uncharacterized protein n=1 Tax=Araneus ventricosus TaxID=182803 RepID=A0A4Y2NQ32_ARAVE|nr:hypothetical protein AVEN_249106-1 [Araneus ventricosus]
MINKSDTRRGGTICLPKCTGSSALRHRNLKLRSSLNGHHRSQPNPPERGTSRHRSGGNSTPHSYYPPGEASSRLLFRRILIHVVIQGRKTVLYGSFRFPNDPTSPLSSKDEPHLRQLSLQRESLTALFTMCRQNAGPCLRSSQLLNQLDVHGIF